MRKIVIMTTLFGSALIPSQVTSAQILEPRAHIEDQRILESMDTLLSKLPDTIECYNVVRLRDRIEHRDTQNKQATAQKHVFHMTNVNFKYAGSQILAENEQSTAIYSLSSGGSNMNIIVGVDMREAKVLVVAPPLPPPNTCQTGMSVARY